MLSRVPTSQVLPQDIGNAEILNRYGGLQNNCLCESAGKPHLLDIIEEKIKIDIMLYGYGIIPEGEIGMYDAGLVQI